jgi:chromosome segregation ATPase
VCIVTSFKMAPALVSEPPAVNGIHTNSGEARKNFLSTGTKKALNALMESAKTLADDKLASKAIESLDELLHLKSEVARLQELDSKRQKEIEDLEQSHQKGLQQHIIAHETRSEELRTQQSDLEDKRNQLREQVDRKEQEVRTLKSQVENQANQIKTLQKAVDAKTQEAAATDKTVQGLKNSLKAQKALQKDLDTTVEQQKRSISQLNEQHDRLDKDHAAMRKRAEGSENELRALAELTVPLKDEPLK